LILVQVDRFEQILARNLTELFLDAVFPVAMSPLPNLIPVAEASVVDVSEDLRLLPPPRVRGRESGVSEAARDF
jgi:hypothetical protein